METSIDVHDDVKLSIAINLLNDFPTLLRFTLVNKKFHNFPWHMKRCLSFANVQGWKEVKALDSFMKVLPDCKALEELQFSQFKIQHIQHEDTRLEKILTTLRHQLVRVDLGYRSPRASEQCPPHVEFPKLRYLRIPGSHEHLMERVIDPETLRNLDEIECTHRMIAKLERSENLKRLRIVQDVKREFGGPTGLKETILKLSTLRNMLKHLQNIDIAVECNRKTRHYADEMRSVLQESPPITLNGHSAWLFISGIMLGTRPSIESLRGILPGSPEQRARDLILISRQFDSLTGGVHDVFINEVKKVIEILPTDSWQLVEHLCCILLLRQLLDPESDLEHSAIVCSEFESLVATRASSSNFVADMLFLEYAPQVLKALPRILALMDHWNSLRLFRRYSTTYSVADWMNHLSELYALISHTKFDQSAFRPTVVDLIVSLWKSPQSPSEELFAQVLQIATYLHSQEPLQGTIGIELQQLAPLPLLKALSTDCELMRTFSAIFVDAPYLINSKNALRMFDLNRGNSEEFRPFAVLLSAHSERFGDCKLEHQQYLDDTHLCNILWRVVVSLPVDDVEQAARAVVAVDPQIPNILRDYLTGHSGVLSDIYNAPEKREIIRRVIEAEFGRIDSLDLQHIESDLYEEDDVEDEDSGGEDDDAMSFSDADMESAEDDIENE